MLILLTTPSLTAQPPASSVHGLPARATPADYQAQAMAGSVTIAADFTGHGIPNAQEPLQSEDYVAVEVGLFGPDGAKLTITVSDFSLRINGKKEAQPSQSPGLVARGIKDPSWVAPEAAGGGSKSKGGISGSAGGGGRAAGDPPPVTPKPPVELLRGWQQRVLKAGIAEGERTLPQAGLLFFSYRGKTDNIQSLELIYNGPAGKATLKLL
jgi:hypothetical protein